MLLIVATKSSEEDHHRHYISDLWNTSIDLATSVWFFNIEFKLKGGLVALFILRSNLDIVRVLTSRKVVMENKHDVACLSLLGNDDFL